MNHVPTVIGVLIGLTMRFCHHSHLYYFALVESAISVVEFLATLFPFYLSFFINLFLYSVFVFTGSQKLFSVGGTFIRQASRHGLGEFVFQCPFQ